MSLLTPGRRGYNAYGNHVGWRDFRGSPIPRWEQLPGIQQDGWEHQAKAILATAARAWSGEALKVHYLLQPGNVRTLCGLVTGGLHADTDCRNVTCLRCRRNPVHRRLMAAVREMTS
jgi:hypothetical protein